MAKLKRARWKMLFKGALKDFDPNCSMEYWRDKTADQKFKEVYELIVQACLIKGKSLTDASRLLRTTALIRKK
jgi:hypothetical protein